MFIFDLDGTLLDSQEGVMSSLKYCIGKHAPSYLPQLHKGLIGPPISILLKEIMSDEELIKTISAEFRVHYDEIGVMKTRLFPGVYEGLENLSKHQNLFVSTNKPWKPTKKILNMLEINEYFHEILTIDSGRFGNKSDMVSKILTTNDAISSVVIGDSIDDFESAVDNQLDFIYCSYGYGFIQNTKGIKVAPSVNKMFDTLLTMV
ncbi:HAD hydrolase-like protein [Candidatus Woesearchaeota archaeon]|jgi:phosphoglycolate phosphatase|nr:HAD hydrolase-like protein [Candidatus Woesearchaeota archaeon]